MLIRKQSELNAFCKAIASAKYIAVDTEFIRQDLYYPKLCLIQVAHQDNIAVIDALTDLNFTELTKILEDKAVLKLFHSGGQDFEAIFYKLKVVPKNFVDTQIAAAFLGFGDAVGYEKLTMHYLGISLNKGLQYSNWEMRPLKTKYIEYAMQDVEFLYQIFKTMRSELKAAKFYEMVKAESKRLYKQLDFNRIVKHLFFKLSDNLDTLDEYMILASLIGLRESVAKKTNTRRSLVLGDDVLFDIVRRRKISKQNSAILGVTSLSDLAEFDLDEKVLDFVEETYAWRNTEVSDFDSLQMQLIALRNRISEETKIASTMIASAAQMRHFILSKFEGSKLVKSWRKTIFADKAFKLLELDK
ncbi:MAG: ribonuclease D [Alphaproteobacteria bacterium]|nr:ribonuclease D [Candidatus Jidaibacter sp.]